MPLEKKTLSFALLKGLDEKSSDPSRDPDALIKADNVEFTKKGQVEKRGGFVLTDSILTKEAFGDTGSVSAGKAISKFQDETLILDGSKMYSKITGSGLYDKGTYVPSTVENAYKRRQIDRRQGNAQIAEANGLRVYVWEEYQFENRFDFGTQYQIFVDVEHIATGVNLVSRSLVASNAIGIDTDSVAGVTCLYKFGQPQCAAIGTRVFIVYKWLNGLGQNGLYYVSVNCAAPENAVFVQSGGSVNDNGGTAIRLSDNTPVFEMDHCAGSTYSDSIACAYINYGGSEDLYVTYLVASGAALAGSATTPINVSTGTAAPVFNGYNARTAVASFTPTGIMMKSLDDASSGASYSLIVGYTHDDSSTKKVQLVAIKDDLSGKNKYTADGAGPGGETGDLWLLNGTVGCATSGAASSSVFLTLWYASASTNSSDLTGVVDETLGRGVAPTVYGSTTQQASIVPEHFIRSYSVNRAAGTFAIATVKTAAFNATVTSDFFRFNSQLYCVVSQVNDNALYPDMSGAAALQRGLTNSSIMLNSDAEIIGAVRTGECSSCFGSEWNTIAPPNGRDTEAPTAATYGRETRRLWHGVQRVTARDTSTRFVFGASRFSGYEFYAAGQYATSDYPDNSFGISLFTADFDPARTLASVDVENGWLGTGGFLHGYDGTQVYENNFVVYPAIRRLKQSSYSTASYVSGSVGGFPNSKTVDYCAVYTWTDSKGSLQQSQPSEIISVTTAVGLAGGSSLTVHGTSGYVVNQVYATTVNTGSGTGATIRVITVDVSGAIVTYRFIEPGSGYANGQILTPIGGSGSARITISSVSLTNSISVDIYIPSFTRKSDISVEVYRNNAETGSVFYLAGQVPVPSSPTKGYVTFKDSPADYAKITEMPVQLYTTDGPPPYSFIGSCTDLVRHQNKIYAAGIDDTVYMSNGIEEGKDVGFVPDFPSYRLSLPGDPGKITGIASNLDHLIIFTESNGFYVTGPGPNLLGHGRFNPPRLFASDQGAKSGSAHVDTPLGVLYQADRGLYLVGRDMSVAYVGAGVEDTVGSKTAVSMTRHDDTNSIRVMLQDTSPGSTGTDVYCLFNYYFKQWSTFGVPYTSSAHQIGEIYDGTSFQRLTADGKQFKQSTTVYQDHNSAGSALVSYAMTVDTGFISHTGLMKKDRTYRYMILGKYSAAHTLTVKVYNNYDTSSPTQTDAVTLSGAPSGLYLYRTHVTNQKARAIQLSIVFSGSTKGAVLEGVSFEVGLRPDKTSFKTAESRSL